MHSIRTKMNVLILSSVIILTIVLAIFNFYSKKQDLMESAEHKLNADLHLSAALIDQTFGGDWSIKEGQLHKGNKKIANDTALVDRLNELTEGSAVTIFQQDERVATSIVTKGERIVGTKADPIVSEQVLEKRKRYQGEANVNGVHYLTVYEPIFDANDHAIGMLFIGVPAKIYTDIVMKSTTTNIIISIIAVVITALIMTFFIRSQITRPLGQLRDTANEVADLNLTSKVLNAKGKDEIAQLAKAFQRMQHHLAEIANQLINSSSQVAESTTTLSISTDQTSESINEVSITISSIANQASDQAEEAHQIADTMTETLHNIKENTAKVQYAVAKAHESTAFAHEGQQTIEQAEQHLTIVMGAAEDSRTSVEKLGEHSKQIDNIITVITDIADQTNLLALNAAIEAARAGEQGKGFAVVADEVRKLAEQSSESAHQITTLIVNIQGEITTMMDVMQRNIEALKEQAQLVQTGGKAFHEIVHKIEETEAQMTYLEGFFEQTATKITNVQHFTQRIMGSAEDSAAVTEEVAAATEEQLAAVEEVTASTEELAQIATNLQKEASKFTTHRHE